MQKDKYYYIEVVYKQGVGPHNISIPIIIPKSAVSERENETPLMSIIQIDNDQEKEIIRITLRDVKDGKWKIGF